MGTIKILDPLTANQIAAGEVVERPVSVVKELVENSIDAGSTRIKVILREGGLKRIQVSDNGCGMTSGDLLLAVERHATSKLATVEDLNSLRTLGFRGEALPSIAAVSRMTVDSRTGGDPVGYRITMIDGKPEEVTEIGCPAGTQVVVEDLFYNTPARRKFLKSPATELGQISDLLGRLALSQPGIAFELIQDRKTLLKTPGNGDLAQAIFAVYGGEILRQMKQICSEGVPAVTGFISLPQVTRSSRHYYNFFLNGRLVKSPELAGILEEAYYTRIPAKRYPVAVIHLDLAPDLFDVNVHPAKLEVKFRDISPVKEAFLQAVADALAPRLIASSVPVIYQKPAGQKNPGEQQQFFGQESWSIKELDPQPPGAEPEKGSEKETGENVFFRSLRVLGQLEGTYLVASGVDGLYIIDQHAAHERIRYEKIKKIYWEQPSATNMLVVPLSLELTHQQSLWLIDQIVKLVDWGFILEHFGDNTFLLRGAPRWAEEENAQELLFALLEKLGNEKDSFWQEKFRDEVIFSLACKSAVKGNRYLSETDINFLLGELDLIDNPFACPHGRPVVIKLTYDEIKRRFFRT